MSATVSIVSSSGFTIGTCHESKASNNKLCIFANNYYVSAKPSLVICFQFVMYSTAHF